MKQQGTRSSSKDTTTTKDLINHKEKAVLINELKSKTTVMMTNELKLIVVS
jgi:hypothetical protein